jgi:hypothetical protein
MSTRFIKRRSAARVVGEAREPRLHTVAEARRISRKSKRLGLLAVQPAPVQRQEEEVPAAGEEEEDHLHAGGMCLDHADQGVPLPGLYLFVVEELVCRSDAALLRPPSRHWAGEF